MNAMPDNHIVSAASFAGMELYLVGEMDPARFCFNLKLRCCDKEIHEAQ